MSALDRPVWVSLSTSHTALSTGNALARRYAPEINLFASARDDTAPALAALADLVRPGERPFLHAWKSNHPAIALYESLGFEIRNEVNVAVLERRA